MSERAPEGPYVYQPYGSVSNLNPFDESRMYGIAGISLGTTIRGLKKDEAERMLAAWLDTPEQSEPVEEETDE